MEERIQLTTTDTFVVYSLPKSDDFVLLQDEQLDNPAIDFVIHPFDKNGSIPAQRIRSTGGLKNQPFSFSTDKRCDVVSTDKLEYLKLANRVINDIQSTAVEKVVLSRIHTVDAQGIDLFDLFRNLMKTYANAFVYLYHIPDQGTWIGATPEILMERKEDVITTVALAATQKVAGRCAESVTWNAKELEEQAIIQRYIEDHLDEKGHAYGKGKTYTSQAGNVFHLKTVYDITNMHSTDELVGQLHPGPAICGLPKKDAMEIILSGEKHHRKYYCGYLGPKTTEKTSLFINLRCMEVFGDQFVLYVGGGLTKDSNAEAEWEETETKTKTLKAVIQKSYIYTHDDG